MTSEPYSRVGFLETWGYSARRPTLGGRGLPQILSGLTIKGVVICGCGRGLRRNLRDAVHVVQVPFALGLLPVLLRLLPLLVEGLPSLLIPLQLLLDLTL